MKKGDNHQNPIGPLVRASLLGCGCGALLSSLLLLLAAAVLASLDQIPEAALQPIVLIAAVAGGFFAGFIGARFLGHMGLIVGISGSFLLLLIIMGISLLLPDGNCLLPSVITKACAILLSGALGGMVSVGKRKKIRRR